MKFKNLLPLAIPLLLSVSACQKEPLVFDNTITINALCYNQGQNLPSPCDSFFLSITRMADTDISNTHIIDKPYLGAVNGSYHFAPPAFGRYVIAVFLDDKKEVIDMIYKGGDLSLSLILK